jgi:hypothetical protein
MSSAIEPTPAPRRRPRPVAPREPAKPVSRPKVLRLGIARGGKIVAERVIGARKSVTCGPASSDRVSIPALDESFELFVWDGERYRLRFDERMDGRIETRSGVVDLGLERRRLRRSEGEASELVLTESSRGKVVLGDTTILFQFVARATKAPGPLLPVSLMNGASHIDWRTTLIAGGSFLVHFTAIGAIYSDWMDPVRSYEIDVSSIVESVRSLPPPPPIEEPQPTTETDESKTEKVEAQPKAAPRTAVPTRGPMNQAQAAALSSDLEKIQLDVLGALAGLGPATANVLQSGEVPTGALDRAAASAAGVGAGGIGLSLGGGGGSIRPGEAGGNLADIGQTGTTAGAGAGKAVAVKGPSGDAAVGSTAVSGGQVSNASRVVAAMRAGFRRCYTRALSTNPDVQGRISLNIKVGPGGEVAGVTASASGNLPAEVIACVQARAKASRFDPPQGGMAVIQVPVTFVKQ